MVAEPAHIVPAKHLLNSCLWKHIAPVFHQDMMLIKQLTVLLFMSMVLGDLADGESVNRIILLPSQNTSGPSVTTQPLSMVIGESLCRVMSK